MRRSNPLAPVPVTIAAIVGACGPADPAPSVLVTDSAGVAIVEAASRSDVSVDVVSEDVLTLGGEDTPEESFYRVARGTVGTDARGNIYVLDRDAYRVQVFDSAGRHLRAMGGQGGGPGELQFPFSLTVAEDGRAWVADVGKAAFVHWGSNGQVMDASPLPQDYRGGDVEWTASGMLSPGRTPDGQELIVVAPSGEATTIARLAAMESHSLDLESCGMRFSGIEPVFAPTLVWAANGTTIAVARNPAYVIDIHQDGRLVRSLRRPLGLRPASAALAEESLGDGMRVGTPGGERVCDPSEVVEQRGFAPYLPSIGGLALAPDGTVWVQRFEVAEGSEPIDIFDAGGRYQGTLPSGSPFPVGFSTGSSVLFSDRDEFDVERLVVRSIQLRPRG